jgi:hypothetical protein
LCVLKNDTMSSRRDASQNDPRARTRLVPPPKIATFGSRTLQLLLTNAHARSRAAGLSKNRARNIDRSWVRTLDDSVRLRPRSISAGSRNFARA